MIEISEIKSFNDKTKLSENGIVDINSNLELKIDKKELTLRVGSKHEENLELINELNKYDNLLIYQKEILDYLDSSLLNLSLTERIEKLGEFSDLMDNFYDLIIEDEELENKFDQYFMEYDALSEFQKNKYNHYVAYGLSQLTNEIASKISSLQTSIDQKKIKIQLSAFLNTKKEQNRKVHIENFDEYSLGEFYEVERWVTSFSDEDIAAFNRTNVYAQNLNSLIDKNFQEISKLVENNINSYQCLNNFYADINDIYNNKDEVFASNLAIGETFIIDIQAEISNMLELIEKIEEYNGQDENVLELFNSIQYEFIENAKQLPGNINTIISSLSAEFINSNDMVINLLDQINPCMLLIKEDLDKIEKVFAISSTILKPFQETAKQGLELGDEIYNYSISDLPEFGYIELKNTGKRSNRDNLVIRLTLKSDDDIEKRKQGIVIEKHIITLQQVKVYSVSNVSVILASPYNYSENVKINNTFQFAPAGSLLFKVGSRKSKTWNFLEPGLGFNISAPDFDLDGIPEVGIGAVFTILQDVVSLGISYNTKTDNPFWFIGLSLPFSTLGMPINTIKTE